MCSSPLPLLCRPPQSHLHPHFLPSSPHSFISLSLSISPLAVPPLFPFSAMYLHVSLCLPFPQSSPISFFIHLLALLAIHYLHPLPLTSHLLLRTIPIACFTLVPLHILLHTSFVVSPSSMRLLPQTRLPKVHTSRRHNSRMLWNIHFPGSAGFPGAKSDEQRGPQHHHVVQYEDRICDAPELYERR